MRELRESRGVIQQRALLLPYSAGEKGTYKAKGHSHEADSEGSKAGQRSSEPVRQKYQGRSPTGNGINPLKVEQKAVGVRD